MSSETLSSTSAGGPVVVGVDGSDNSQRALGWAVGYARGCGVPLVVLAAWDIPANYGYPLFYQGGNYERFETQAHSMLSRSVEETDTDELDVELRAVRGHPAIVLVEAAKGSQLLVVGSRGHGAFAGMILGSVSQHCTQHAHCPVVVVPPGE